eukprot:6253350-Karenia_brevis.AAC.1
MCFQRYPFPLRNTIQARTPLAVVIASPHDQTGYRVSAIPDWDYERSLDHTLWTSVSPDQQVLGCDSTALWLLRCPVHLGRR